MFPIIRWFALFFLALSASWSLQSSGQTPTQQTFDVVVYGGTAGGAIAAVAAADQGLRVLLLEPRNHIGGMTSGGLGRTDYAKKYVIGGMSREFYQRLGRHYKEPISWFFEPRVAEKVLVDWLTDCGASVLFGHRVDSVEKEGARISSITLENGASFTAKVFIDASYEGDLLPRAGISYTWGREGQEVYDESLAGRIVYSDKHQFPFAVSPRGQDGRLLPLVYAGDPGQPGQGDKKVQAYNFRLCLTDIKENQVPFPKPEAYDPARYEILRRYLELSPELAMDDLMIVSMMPNRKTDINNRGPISTDYIGGSWDYPEADYETREKIWEDHIGYVQGFMYFLANDPSVPKALQEEINQWGLAKDEFVDTGHWPHQLYVREARRMIGEYVMHQADLQTERTKADSIGMGSYNSDSHHVQRIPAGESPDWPSAGEGMLNEGDMQVPVEPYEISYRCLVPKKAECENLFVISCFSASHVAYSSMRMEPQYMIIGQAAGVAAAQSIRSGRAVQDIDIAALRKTLLDQGQILSVEAAPEIFPPLDGFVVDSAHAETVGKWRNSASIDPYYGFGYLHAAEKPEPGDLVRFVPDLPKAGLYEIRLAYSADENRATNVKVRIATQQGPQTVEVNQQKPIRDRVPFLSLGKFSLGAGPAGAVEVLTEGADGYVVADAVQWILVE